MFCAHFEACNVVSTLMCLWPDLAVLICVPQVVYIMEHGGNARDHAVYLGKWSPVEYPKPDSEDKQAVRKFMMVSVCTVRFKWVGVLF